jgi:hypothetical protein
MNELEAVKKSPSLMSTTVKQNKQQYCWQCDASKHELLDVATAGDSRLLVIRHNTKDSSINTHESTSGNK